MDQGMMMGGCDPEQTGDTLGLVVPGSRKAYRLAAVVCHRGSAAYAGHYVTYVLGSDGSWKEHDDSRTSRVEADHVLPSWGSREAYLAFYQHTGSD